MKDLYNYITESLLDIDDVHNKLNTSAIKKEISAWIKTNMKKKSGRIKVSPKPNEDGQFIVSYMEYGSALEIDFSNVPDYILFDINLYKSKESEDGYLNGGVLTIKNANNISVLPKFQKFNAQSLALQDSKCTLDSPKEKSSINTLYLQYGGQLSVELGDLSNVEIKSVMTDRESCVNFSPLKNVKEFEKLYIKATRNSTYNLNGLKGKFLQIMNYERSDRQANVTGKFDFDSIDLAMMTTVTGLPSNMKKLKDTYGYSLLTVKSIQEFVLGPWIDDIADQILTRLHTGALKIKTITHYQAPYEEIPYDEFITKLRMRYTKFAVIGEDTGHLQGHWNRITIQPNKFKTWAKTTNYEIVRSDKNFPGKLYMILKDGAPIGAYIEDNGGYNGWSSVDDNVLCTSDKKLMGEIVEL